MQNATVKDGFLGQQMIKLPRSLTEELTANPLTQFFYPTDMGYYPNASLHYRSRKEGAQEYIFIYCVEGEGWLETEKERSKVRPNQFFMIQKSVQHQYGANSKSPWSIYWMHFKGKSAKELYAKYSQLKTRVVDIPFDNSRILTFNHIFKILSGNQMTNQIEYSCILSLSFISSFIYIDTQSKTTTFGNENMVTAITDFLINNLDKTFTAADIANQFKYSSSYIFSTFKKQTGYSLMHFFNLKKMQKACEYINYTDLSIKEISYKVGFQDPLYFSRIFKKYMGMSPKFYKNQQIS